MSVKSDFSRLFIQEMNEQRRWHKVSQAKLAKQIGYHRTQITNLEAGHSDLSLEGMLRLAIRFNIKVDRLIRIAGGMGNERV